MVRGESLVSDINFKIHGGSYGGSYFKVICGNLSFE